MPVMPKTVVLKYFSCPARSQKEIIFDDNEQTFSIPSLLLVLFIVEPLESNPITSSPNN